MKKKKEAKKIAAYTHPAPPPTTTETPDTAPGNYYVSMVDPVSNAGDIARSWLVLGPFKDNHAGALAAVGKVHDFYRTHDHSGRSHWYAFGTVRMAYEVDRPGNVNKYLPELLAA